MWFSILWSAFTISSHSFLPLWFLGTYLPVLIHAHTTYLHQCTFYFCTLHLFPLISVFLPIHLPLLFVNTNITHLAKHTYFISLLLFSYTHTCHTIYPSLKDNPCLPEESLASWAFSALVLLLLWFQYTCL